MVTKRRDGWARLRNQKLEESGYSLLRLIRPSLLVITRDIHLKISLLDSSAIEDGIWCISLLFLSWL